jgi:hypothetical protein
VRAAANTRAASLLCLAAWQIAKVARGKLHQRQRTATAFATAAVLPPATAMGPEGRGGPTPAVVATDEIETNNPVWKAGAREPQTPQPPAANDPRSSKIAQRFADAEEGIDAFLAFLASESGSPSTGNRRGDAPPGGAAQTNAAAESAESGRADLTASAESAESGRADLAASADGGDDKTFVTIDAVAIMAAPAHNAAILSRVAAGETFVACGEATLHPAEEVQTEHPEKWLDHPQTLLRVRLDRHGITPTDSSSAFGWIAEEDAAGSVVCVDLGRCLQPPLSELCLGRHNRFHDGYYRLHTRRTKQPRVYLTLNQVKDTVVGGCTTSGKGVYYKTDEPCLGECPAGTVVKALSHKMQVQKKSFPGHGEAAYISFIRTPRGWMTLCEVSIT